MSEKTLFVS